MTSRRNPPRRCLTALAVAVAASASSLCALSAIAGTAGAASADFHAPRVGNLGITGSSSLDWAGYAVTGSGVTSVSGSWVQPTVTCPGTKLQQSAFWVGIDGFAASDPTVEQVGTDADCTKKAKKNPSHPVHYAWFELYPAGLVVLPPAIYPVVPGDVLSGSVQVSGSSYVITLVDAGRWTFHTTQTPASQPQNSSAEWITEAPTLCTGTKCKVAPLADFGSIGFTGATVNGMPIATSGLAQHEITMTTKKAKAVKAAPSILSSGGSAFSVSWFQN